MAHVVQLLRDKRPLLDRGATRQVATEVVEGDEIEPPVREASTSPA